MGLFKKKCYTQPNCVAPNPDPLMYKVTGSRCFKNATLLEVKYTGCTNFEGKKILVFLGDFTPVGNLDPHFSEDDKSPIARFKPDAIGLRLAIQFCESLTLWLK